MKNCFNFRLVPSFIAMSGYEVNAKRPITI